MIWSVLCAHRYTYMKKSMSITLYAHVQHMLML